MISKLYRSGLIGILVAAMIVPLWAQTQNQATNTATGSSSGPTMVPRGPLSEEENPLLIGKRNINKHQLNFYSLEKEAAAGRQFAAEVDRSVKLVDDLRRAILDEGMRRVGQFGERHVQAELAWPGDPAPFANINTPEELKAAEARLARARSRARR